MHFSKLIGGLILAFSLTSCSTTSSQSETAVTVARESYVAATLTQESKDGKEAAKLLTLEKILADPDWIGTSPSSAYWGLDSQTAYFQRKRVGSDVRELWQLNTAQSNSDQKVALSQIHQFSHQKAVFNRDNSKAAWLYANNVFVQELTTGKLTQLTRDNQQRQNLMFMLDGRIAFQSADAFYAIDLQTGQSALLASWKFEDKPKANKVPKDMLAKEQLKLIQTLQNVRDNRQSAFDYRRQVRQQNSAISPDAFYLTEEHYTAEASLSPNGRWLILSIAKTRKARNESDLMPNYVTESGRIANQEVRQRVADAKEVNQQLWLLDLETGKKNKLDYVSLPGYNEDVLAEVKRENHAAHGLDYEDNRLPREIGLINNWYWRESPFQWHQNGEQVGIMLEAWDNKDRWIATVDFEQAKLVNQHRLHDKAWINYKFNRFGWLASEPTLYYLSEESGYSHLYLKPLDGEARAVTSGRYEVDQVTLSKDDKYAYFQANKEHPGIYEIYRINISTGQQERLTKLNGMSNYALSPDEKKLLITHSSLTQPDELFVQALEANAAAVQLTQSTTKEFDGVNWSIPQIIAIPSSHTEQPIYARLYLPENYQGENNKAVVFNHGAGYLQNAHLGWSAYFREFMFHSLLVQHGYVVLDMDYRASAGYGRDWRTAIYRQMGTPEVQDLQDGINWLAENVGVDTDKVGTYGGSYGGFLTFMAMFKQPDMFQAGAALRPVSDWAHYNTPYTANILNTPDLDPIAYRRSSPIYFAEGLQKPLLINAPMLDSNVFFQDVVRLVQRLIELEKQDFETAIYPLEGHGFKHASSWLDEYRRIFKLFEDNL